jgi:hypothetical protein
MSCLLTVSPLPLTSLYISVYGNMSGSDIFRICSICEFVSVSDVSGEFHPLCLLLLSVFRILSDYSVKLLFWLL